MEVECVVESELSTGLDGRGETLACDFDASSCRSNTPGPFGERGSRCRSAL